MTLLKAEPGATFTREEIAEIRTLRDTFQQLGGMVSVLVDRLEEKLGEADEAPLDEALVAAAEDVVRLLEEWVSG